MAWFNKDNEDGQTKRQALMLALLVVSLSIVAWRLWAAGEDPTQLRVRETYYFTCVEEDCAHEWQADLQHVSAHFGGGQPSSLYPVICVECERRSAFMNERCPWCDEPFIPRHRLEGGLPKEVICPHCGKDTYKWKAGGD